MKKIDWYHSLFVFGLFFILVNIFGSMIMIAYSDFILGEPFSFHMQFELSGIIIGASTMLIFMVLTPILYLKLLKVDYKSFFDIKKPSAKDVVLATIGVIAIGTVISWIMAQLTESYPRMNDGLIPMGIDFHEEVAKHFRDASFLATLGLVIIIGVFPGIGEEVLFRGFMQRLLQQRFNFFMAVILSGGLFASVHLIQQISQAIAAFLISFYLGYLFYKTKNLALPIVGHIVNNSLFGFMSYFFPDLPANEAPPMLAVLVSAAVGAYTIYYFSTRKPVLGN